MQDEFGHSVLICTNREYIELVHSLYAILNEVALVFYVPLFKTLSKQLRWLLISKISCAGQNNHIFFPIITHAFVFS